MVWVQQTSPVPQVLRSVFVIDSLHVVAVGDSGAIITTSDGTNWGIANNNSPNDLYGVSFRNAQTGWAVGSGGIILRSDNGGQDWAPDGSAAPNTLRGVQVIPVPPLSYHGLCVGDGGAARVNNNGSWSVANNPNSPNLRAVSVVPSASGWQAWAGGSPQNPATSGLMGQYPPSTNRWINNPADPTGYYGVSLTKDYGWCCGDGGTIRKKIGSNWVLQGTPPGTPKLNAISMLSDQLQGCAVGDNGCILWCLGGGTWAPMVNPLPAPCAAFYGVHFISDQVGWVVGDRGTILQFQYP
jgi:photosystem II stability/assembly factor-like uncharacterized protein